MERNQKSLFGKNSELRAEKEDEFHSVCTNTMCAWLAWDFTTGLAADTEQQQSGTQGSVLRTLSHLMLTLCTLAWWSSSTQRQSPRIRASRFVLTSLRTYENYSS